MTGKVGKEGKVYEMLDAADEHAGQVRLLMYDIMAEIKRLRGEVKRLKRITLRILYLLSFYPIRPTVVVKKYCRVCGNVFDDRDLDINNLCKECVLK